ncbi:ribosome biogenesis protein, partial [Bacteroides salyersiae]
MKFKYYLGAVMLAIILFSFSACDNDDDYM